MLGLLELAPLEAPREGKASPRKRGKATRTSMEDEEEGKPEVEIADDGGGAAPLSGEDEDEVTAGTGSDGNEATSKGEEVAAMEKLRGDGRTAPRRAPVALPR